MNTLRKDKLPKIQNWFQEKGDETLALDWPGVDEDSVVWEIGGYEGRWALQMAEKYNPNLFVFEPQKWACDKIMNKLNGYKATVKQVALWTHRTVALIGDFERDGASLLKEEHKDRTEVLCIDAYQFFYRHKQGKDIEVDVCLMNIEGGEFVLLPYMIGMGIMQHIKYFWCQWHLFVPRGYERWEQLEKMLLQTHEPYWDCGAVAQAWVRRE